MIKQEKILCNHPIDKREDYHDSSIICTKCNEVIEQFGEKTNNKGYYFVDIIETKMNTPLKEAIEKIKSLVPAIEHDRFIRDSCINILTELLPKEKEFAKDLFEKGFEYANEVDFEIVFKTKYKQ